MGKWRKREMGGNPGNEDKGVNGEWVVGSEVRNVSTLSVHVRPTNGHWGVQIDPGFCVSEHRVQMGAIRFGRELAKSHGAKFVVHGRNGQVRSRLNYGMRRRVRGG